MKKLFFALVAMVALVACGPQPGGGSTVESIALEPSSLSLKVNASQRLSVVVNPSGVKATLVWSSSNSDVATVSTNGTVEGRAEGSAVITATVEGTDIKATCAVTVVNEFDAVEFTRLAFGRSTAPEDRYTVEYKRSDGTMRKDSCCICYFYFLGKGLYLGAEDFTGTNDYLLYFPVAMPYNEAGAFLISGGLSLVEDACKATLTDSLGQVYLDTTFARPFIYNGQYAKFDEEVYIDYATQILIYLSGEGSQPSIADYPYIRDMDAELLYYYFAEDESTGESFTISRFGGYTNGEGYIDLFFPENAQYMNDLTTPSYSIPVVFLNNVLDFGIATEEHEDGNIYYKDPIQLAPRVEKTLVKVDPSAQAAPRTLAIPANQINARTSADRVLYAPMMMRVDDHKFRMNK